MWPDSGLSLIWAARLFPRDLCQSPLVRKLFKPAVFGSRFSCGVRAQSSSEARIKFSISWMSCSWVAIYVKVVTCYNIIYFPPNKSSSGLAASLLVVRSCWSLWSGWRFALFCGGECLILLSGLSIYRGWFSVSSFPSFTSLAKLFSSRLYSSGNLISMP